MQINKIKIFIKVLNDVLKMFPNLDILNSLQYTLECFNELFRSLHL
jgi:hypothetical protein